MADVAALERALINADAAGDTAAAQALAGEISRQRSVNTAPAQNQPGVIEDVVKGGASGLAQGGINAAGLGGDVRTLIGRGIDAAGGALGAASDKVQQFKELVKTGARMTTAGQILANASTSDDLRKGVESVTGPLYQPQTTAGHYAKTIGEFAPGILGGPGSIGARALTNVVAPAVLSETAGQLTQGSELEPYARVGGALASPALFAAGRHVATPLASSPERRALVDTLRREGVDLTAGQTTGNKPLQWAESTFGDMLGSGGRSARMMDSQAEQFTSAALRRAGETANRATPEVVDRAFSRIGKNFDDLAARNWAEFDGPFVRDLQRVNNEYSMLVPASQRAPIVDNLLQDIINTQQTAGGVMTGEAYQALRSRIDRLARGAKNDSQLSEALQGIRNALDNVTERTIAIRNPHDLGEWRNARREYKNMLVVEKAAAGAGSNAAEGLISPSQLRNAVVTQNKRSYVRGQGDFADLARAGEAVMKPLPNSGTAPRMNVQNMLQTLSSVLGGTAGSVGGPGGSALGVVAGLAAPGAMGRAIMSAPAQRYLSNQRFAGAGDVSRVADLWPLILSSSAAREVALPSSGGQK